MAISPLVLVIFSCFIVCVSAVVNETASEYEDPDDTQETVRGKLIQVSVITRHGQRTPKDPYPADPYRSPSYWPEGWLQLTAVGAEQHKTLGKWLRNRYSDVIPATFTSAEVHIRSTGIARTLASAYALTSTLFPDGAIPIFSAPSDCDKLMSPHKNCPAYDEELNRFLTSTEVKEEELKRRPFYKWMERHMGKKVDGLGATEGLYSLLTIETQRGLKIPYWTVSAFPQPLRNLTAKYLSYSSATPLLARLRYGSMLKEILDNAEKAGIKKYKKFLLYSAHDFTVIGILNCMGLFDGVPPGFASSITFEVHYGDEINGNIVDIYYRNDSIVEPKKLVVKGCEDPCYVPQLKLLLEAVLPEDIERECSEPVPVLCSTHPTGSETLLAIVSLCSAVFGAVVVILFTKLMSQYEYNDERQPFLLNQDRTRRHYTEITGHNIGKLQRNVS